MYRKARSTIVLTSLCAIALAGSVLAGATYALFTSESKVNIAVTSGNVNVTATIENLKTYSGVDLTGDANDDIKETQDGEFTNGGKAILDGGILKLEKMTPGDKATFDIKVTNNSNVKTKYRTYISSTNDTGLFNGLNVSVGNEKFYGFTVKSSLKDLSQEGEVETVHVEVYLPSDAGNAYQDKTCEMKFVVEAYQGNAKVEEAASNELELYTVEDLFGFARAMTNKAFNEEPLNVYDTVKLMNDLDLDGKEWTPIDMWDSENLNTFTIDGNNHTISNMDIECKGYGGFIGKNSRFVTIKDLVFKEASIKTSFSYNGVVIGYAYGKISLENVDVADSSVIGSSETEKIIRTGGLIGFVPNDANQPLILKDCDVTNSTVSGYHSIGAIVGSLMTNGSVTVTDCTASNNKLVYASQTIGAFNFGSSTSGYVEYVPAEGFTATNNTIIREIASGLTYYDGKYHIASVNGLQAMKELVEDAVSYDDDGTWVLEEDLDLKDVEWSPINDFYGEFDGNSKTISNLTVSASASAGLFGKNTLNKDSNAVATPTIHDLKFTNANVSGVKGVGVVAGWINFGNVSDISVKDSFVEGEEYVGGIVGIGNAAGGTKISNCKVIDCTIQNTDGTVEGKIGGIAGFIVPGSILNCSVTGSTITGYRCVGGIVGRAGTSDGAVSVKGNTVSDNTVSKFSSSSYTNVGSIYGDALNITTDSQTNS